MAKPVIDSTTSVLGYKQWEPWEFQGYATNAPTSWSISAVPPGMSFNTTTGKLSGAATAAGVYTLVRTATNADGDSVYDPTATPPILNGRLVIGIEAAPMPNSAINVDWDTQSGEITLRGIDATGKDAAGKLVPLLSAKEDDDLLFIIRCLNGGTVLDLPLTSLKFAAKEFEPERVVVLSTDGFYKVGAGTATYYILHAHLDRAKLASVLSNYEADTGTLFAALGEFERVESNIGYPDATAGPATLRSTSRTFILNIERDLIQ